MGVKLTRFCRKSRVNWISDGDATSLVKKKKIRERYLSHQLGRSWQRLRQQQQPEK